MDGDVVQVSELLLRHLYALMPDRTRSVQDREAAPWGEVISSANNRVTMTGYWKLSSMQKKIPALKRVRGLPYFNA
jgi:hypothetical protein